MAYATSNPPSLMTSARIGSTGLQQWDYRSTDDAATVDGAGYFTNGLALGMRVGDVVFVTDTDASPVIVTQHQVSAVSLAGTDVNNLTTITQTDSD